MPANTTSRLWTTVLILVTSLGALHRASAAEPVSSPEQQQQEIARLIEQLASENPKPKNVTDSDGERVTVFPPGYSRDRQNKVHRAADELRKFGIDAFPQIIDHFDDHRYSYSEEAMNARSELFYSRSVGSHCMSIVCAQLYMFETWGDPWTGFGPTWDGHPELRSKSTAQRWWAKNKGKPLWRLQTDMLEWAIDLELNTKHATEWNSRAAMEAVKSNRTTLAELLATRKALSQRPSGGK